MFLSLSIISNLRDLFLVIGLHPDTLWTYSAVLHYISLSDKP